jgi:hypothetical protein
MRDGLLFHLRGKGPAMELMVLGALLAASFVAGYGLRAYIAARRRHRFR